MHFVIRAQRHFARERIAERLQIKQERMRPDDAPERPHERREKQARDAAMQPVRDARVVAFAKVEAKIRIRKRVAEAGQQFA